MNRYSKYSEKDLIILLQQNDESAFRAVFDRWHKKLYHFSLRYLHNKEQAEEAVQDALLKLWTHRDKIDVELSLDAFLYTICKRLCLNRLRDAAKSNIASEILWENYIDLSNDTEETVRATELQKLMDQAVKRMPPQQQLVFHMSKNEGLSHLDIAKKLKISKETVKKHSAEALKFLRLQLKQYLTLISSIIFLFSP